tara:strand:+ start:374 stop:805 length:432 start_codon:yes stop_codon:yes gene_type:complete
MSECVFKQIKENTYKCKNCGQTIESIYGPELFSMECSYSPEQENAPKQDTGNTPSFLEMAKNAGTSMVNHAMNSFQSVPANVKEERISICQGCEHYNSESTRCNECGCFINIKADWASEKCPIDKWDMWTGGQSGGCGGCGKK